ncbi:hypothetical protein N7537_003063 [Penicillium hordei]|uniref:Uncharacterized protein n=1 Tax=Penicillium hordei TaxID=40994 RepID=A0AAD6EJN4_9EURO|nr:uncharacterized protein N7537_003063 [Penicillium hordei]KAJ5617949.1 hypothetical protein N7537_003063 [Penicillium hordei]
MPIDNSLGDLLASSKPSAHQNTDQATPLPKNFGITRYTLHTSNVIHGHCSDRSPSFVGVIQSTLA